MSDAANDKFGVIDLFSGAGGMSWGFHAHPSFSVLGAADAQNGKPSSGKGSLQCNQTYFANIGVRPIEADLSTVAPEELAHSMGVEPSQVDVLISCAPCTGFSRTVRQNLVQDDARNNLVRRTAEFVAHFDPKVLVMENVGELLNGKFSGHFAHLRDQLSAMGFSTIADVHNLSAFGVPQNRQRALVIATKAPFEPHSLESMWDGYQINEAAKTVRAAISHLPAINPGQPNLIDSAHVCPNLNEHSIERLRRIPPDGGSWPDILDHADGNKYLIPSMRRYSDVGKVGPYRDVYGRMWWDKPAVTIKRECSHPGNGRYCHPDQHRHCSVRELGLLQGFPRSYRFEGTSLSNRYRHVGDAVPPIVSYQIAWAVRWSLTGLRPAIEQVLLPDTHLDSGCIERANKQPVQLALSGVKAEFPREVMDCAT